MFRMFYQFVMRSDGVAALKLNRFRLNVRMDAGALRLIARRHTTHSIPFSMPAKNIIGFIAILLTYFVMCIKSINSHRMCLCVCVCAAISVSWTLGREIWVAKSARQSTDTSRMLDCISYFVSDFHSPQHRRRLFRFSFVDKAPAAKRTDVCECKN